MINIENLHLNIEGKEILKGIDLVIKPGDIYGLLGPNGAGKSTTIFSILGLRKYGSGHIRVFGHDPAKNAVAIRRSVGVMPENAEFYGWMTASDYFKWMGRLYDVLPAKSDLMKLLTQVGLKAEIRQPIRTYSKGMKQRLAIARALFPHPELLILDEPTSGIDPKGRREIHDLLLEFTARGKTSVLLCTHLIDDVDRLCNRIGIIDQGQTRIEGRLDELLGKSTRYRLRLENDPKESILPDGISILSHEGGWWRVQIKSQISNNPSALWEQLLKQGWRITEIRSESSNLEELYLKNTGQDQSQTQAVAA